MNVHRPGRKRPSPATCVNESFWAATVTSQAIIDAALDAGRRAGLDWAGAPDQGAACAEGRPWNIHERSGPCPEPPNVLEC